MEKDLWKPDDPDWMREREREWTYVKANLEEMDPVIPKRSHQFHKELFFEGKLDPILSDSSAMLQKNIEPPFDWYLTIFRMWYLPVKDLGLFKEIFENEDCLMTLGHCRNFLFGRFPLSYFTTEYGMFGGREELLVQTFILGLDFNELIVNGRRKYSHSLTPHMTMRYCVDHSSKLLSSTDVNPFAPGQYLWDHLSFAADKYEKKTFKNKLDLKQLRTCLRRILDWDERTDAPRERANVVDLRNTLLKRFEAEDFSAPLIRLWKEEKAAYERGDPYPEW